VHTVSLTARTTFWAPLACRELSYKATFWSIKCTDVILLSRYSHAWRNFGILIAYCIFNVFGAMAIYYLARVVSSVCAHRLVSACLSPLLAFASPRRPRRRRPTQITGRLATSPLKRLERPTCRIAKCGLLPYTFSSSI